MLSYRLIRFSLVVTAGLIPGLANAASYNVVSDETRALTAEREVHVLSGQAEIKPDIVGSNVAAAAGGGLLMALIDAGVESSRTKKAEEAIQPLRSALASYHFDDAARQATQDGLAKVEWLHGKQIVVGKDSSEVGKLALLDAATTDQIAVFDFSYDTLPNFTGVRVTALVQLLNKATPAGKKPNSRLAAKQTGYTSSLISVVPISGLGADPVANVGKLAENDAQLTRKALDLALEQLRMLIPRALNLTPAEAETLKKSKEKKQLVAGYLGKPVERTAEGSDLLFGDLRFGNVWAFESWLAARTLP